MIFLCVFFLQSCKQKVKDKEPAKEESLTCETFETYGGVESVPAPLGEKPSDGDWLIYRLGAEPPTLNTITATDAYEQLVHGFIADGLLDMDIKTQEFEPALAERWEISEDKLTFTFYLRKDVKWHDGVPFTADDIIYSFERIMDPKVDAAVMRSYYSQVEKLEKLDDHTIRIIWKKPYFKAIHLSASFPIVPKHILDDGTDFNQHPFGRRPVFTGPYRFVEWKTGQEIIIERNPDYWGEKPRIDKIIFRLITNDDAALIALKQGKIDFFERLQPMQWVKQTNSKSFLNKINKIYYDYPQYRYIGWNLRNPLFEDKRVRQAMTMMLNREAILARLMHCLGKIVSGNSYINTPYYDQGVKPRPHDPERAKALLDEAGWIDSDGDGWRDKDGKPFRFEFSFTAEVPFWEQLATIYKEDLKDIGVDMVIRKFEWAVFLENVQEWKFDACGMGWALTIDPDFYQLWHSSQADIKASSNHVGFKSEEMDNLIELNRREFDKAKRIEYSHRVHQILHEEQPYTFLFNAKKLSGIDKRFHNIITYAPRPAFEFDQWYAPENIQKYSTATPQP
jgi:peptide/nickel transport system substrate-binding protein